jgi:hypothetical protein
MSPNQPERAEHPIEMISAYMDGRLEAAERERVHDHLGACTPCQWILADFRALAAAARREAPPPIPAYLLEKIGRRLDAESTARPVPALSRIRPRARLSLATAAAVLLAASLWVVLRGRIPGERLAESRSNATPPVSAPSADQAPAAQPESAMPQKTEPAVPSPSRQAAPPPAATAPGRQADAFAPSPPAASPKATGLPSIKKDQATSVQPPADRDESKEETSQMKMVPSQAVPAPAERLDNADAEANRTAAGEQAAASAPAGAATEALGGPAKPAAASRMTLVLVLPEARVLVLPDLGVVLSAGDYVCTLPAGGQDEARGLAELRAYAAGQRRVAGTMAAGRPAPEDSPESGEPRDLVVPAPPAGGPLSPEAATETHRRIWVLLREGLLARAEAQCGPAPKVLHPER